MEYVEIEGGIRPSRLGLGGWQFAQHGLGETNIKELEYGLHAARYFDITRFHEHKSSTMLKGKTGGFLVQPDADYIFDPEKVDWPEGKSSTANTKLRIVQSKH
jgi:hypothetical protein